MSFSNKYFFATLMGKGIFINCIICCKILVHCLPIAIFLSVIPNRSALDFVYIVVFPMSIILEISLMLALCFMLSSPYYAKNYTGIIDSSLLYSARLFLLGCFLQRTSIVRPCLLTILTIAAIQKL